eukprot:gene4957-gene3353
MINAQEEENLAECALRIRRILEGIKNLLEGYYLPRSTVFGSPNNAVRSVAQLLGYFVPPQDMCLNRLSGHG